MNLEIKIPSPGESISEVEISRWMVKSGDYVEKDQEIGEIESEKATLPLMAGEAGVITILQESGKASVGAIVASIDTSAKSGFKPKKPEPVKKAGGSREESKVSAAPPKAETEIAKPKPAGIDEHIKISPVAKKLMDEHGLKIQDVLTGMKRISKQDVELVLNGKTLQAVRTASRNLDKKALSPLRKKLGERLVSVKNETAMLTTFNEADMSAIQAMRKKYQEAFVKKHGIKLGFMSFFVKAATEALQAYPMVNSMLIGDEIITPSYVDISIAVQTDKGLMVPVLKNTEILSIPEIEVQIASMAAKARSYRLTIEEMTGGTFTITNGGVFGSLMSTPILNPPQSAIMGMHKIMDRPVAIDGKIEIRPMMFLAISYDHRIVDGRDSVGFLVKIKELIEDPVRLLLGKDDPERLLLGL